MVSFELDMYLTKYLIGERKFKFTEEIWRGKIPTKNVRDQELYKTCIVTYMLIHGCRMWMYLKL